MKNTWNKAAWLLLASPILLASCDKNDTGELEGPKPTASFTTSAKTEGLTTKVTFTSTSTDGFLYRWDFGDGTSGTGQTVVHEYKKGGTLKATLTVAGRGGTAISAPMNVVLPDVTTLVKQLLTGTTSKTWILNNTVVAPIIVGTEGNPGQYYPGAAAGQLPACQADDEYTFSATNIYTYDAKTGTVVAQQGQTCQAPRSDSTPFTYGAATGAGYAMITLQKAGSFIGATDVPDLTYRIIDITDKTMVLRGGGPNGTVFQYKMIAK